MKVRNFMPILIVVIILSVFASTLFAVDHTEPVPLIDLGNDTYLGEAGGLYPNQSNTPPSDYVTNEIQPIYDLLQNDDHIVVLCLGMSNLKWTCEDFISKAEVNANVNSSIQFFNGGQPGRAQQAWHDPYNPNDDVWVNANKPLLKAGETPGTVDVILYFNAWANPEQQIGENFSIYTDTMLDSLKLTMDNFSIAYPNTQLIYVTSREYGGYATVDLNPDPWAYWDGFAFKRLVEDRINGVIDGPPILWQAYQYDPTWPRSYFKDDGVHLLEPGLDAASQLWLDFYLTQPWFGIVDSPPLGTPTSTPTLTPTPTPTSTPFFDQHEYLPLIIQDK